MLEKVKWQSQTKYFDKQNQKSTRGLLTGKVPGSRCGCQCLFFVMQNVWVNGRELVMEHIGWYLTDCEDVYMQVTERFCCLWSKCLMTRRGCRHRASYTTLTDVLMRVDQLCVAGSFICTWKGGATFSLWFARHTVTSSVCVGAIMAACVWAGPLHHILGPYTRSTDGGTIVDGGGRGRVWLLTLSW